MRPLLLRCTGRADDGISSPSAFSESATSSSLVSGISSSPSAFDVRGDARVPFAASPGDLGLLVGRCFLGAATSSLDADGETDFLGLPDPRRSPASDCLATLPLFPVVVFFVEGRPLRRMTSVGEPCLPDLPLALDGGRPRGLFSEDCDCLSLREGRPTRLFSVDGVLPPLLRSVFGGRPGPLRFSTD
jgi:hypothetical protein